MTSSIIYIGVDPGVSGGIALLQGDEVDAIKMPEDDRAIWRWFEGYKGVDHRFIHVAIEIIPPAIHTSGKNESGENRPDSGKSQMSKLYGSFRACRMAIIASGQTPIEVGSRAWQKALGIPPRKKTPRTEWKNKLKDVAQSLYPQIKVTLSISDSLLIAHYCRMENKL